MLLGVKRGSGGDGLGNWHWRPLNDHSRSGRYLTDLVVTVFVATDDWTLSAVVRGTVSVVCRSESYVQE